MIIIIMVSIFFRSVVSNLQSSGRNLQSSGRRKFRVNSEIPGNPRNLQSSGRRKFRVPGRVATPMDFYTGHLINFSEYTDHNRCNI